MKLLFDENLSRRLVEFVQDLLPGSVHVTQVGLSSGTADREVELRQAERLRHHHRRQGFHHDGEHTRAPAKSHNLGEL